MQSSRLLTEILLFLGKTCAEIAVIYRCCNKDDLFLELLLDQLSNQNNKQIH